MLKNVVALRIVLQLLVTAYVVPSSLIRSTLMMEAIHSSKMQFLTRATLRHITEDGILHSHRRENLKSYIPIPNSGSGFAVSQ
jgi:hypothetical protein